MPRTNGLWKHKKTGFPREPRFLLELLQKSY